MARFNQFQVLMRAWKRVFSKSPLRKEAMEIAKCPRKKGPKGGARYRCAKCKKDFGSWEVEVDHIDPVIPLERLARGLSWGDIENRLFCDLSNLQVICKDCHAKKNRKEMAARKRNKRQ